MSLKLPLIIISYFILVSCNRNQTYDQNTTGFVINALKLSTKEIKANTQKQYEIIDNKLVDIRLNNIAKIWQPKALEIKKHVTLMGNYLDSIKMIEESQKPLDESLVFKRFSNFFSKLLIIDPGFAFTKSKINLDSFKFIRDQNTKLRIYSLENYIAVIENELVQFCNSNTGVIHDTWGSNSILINQNSKHFIKGELLQIEAGIGTFSRSALPKIVINGRECEVNGGRAIYKQYINDKPGNYSIPVEIKYYNQEGEVESGVMNINYSIDR